MAWFGQNGGRIRYVKQDIPMVVSWASTDGLYPVTPGAACANQNVSEETYSSTQVNVDLCSAAQPACLATQTPSLAALSTYFECHYSYEGSRQPSGSRWPSGSEIEMCSLCASRGPQGQPLRHRHALHLDVLCEDAVMEGCCCEVWAVTRLVLPTAVPAAPSAPAAVLHLSLKTEKASDEKQQRSSERDEKQREG